MYTLSVLFLTFFFTSNNLTFQKVDHYVLTYTIENIENENQLLNLKQHLLVLYKACNIKHRYKPENKRGQIIIDYQESNIKGEFQKQSIDPSVIKQQIIHFGMSPVDFTIEKN